MKASKTRLVVASVVMLAALAPLAGAQTPPDPTVTAPAAPAAATPPPPATAAQVAPMAASPAPEPPPPAPAPPPGPPTDPTAIALLKTLEDVCVPAAARGDKDIGKVARAEGYRKAGDNWVYRGAGFQFTLLAPGSNPNVCQVQITHPIDPNPQTPAKPLVEALHNWATYGHDFSLVSNFKNNQGTDQYITKSWEKSADGANQALVLTTTRKADGSPEMRNADTSTMLYSVTKASS